MIKEQEKVYKCLGVDESSGSQDASMKQKLKKEIFKMNKVDSQN